MTLANACFQLSFLFVDVLVKHAKYNDLVLSLSFLGHNCMCFPRFFLCCGLSNLK